MKHVHLLLCFCLLASVSVHAQNDNSQPLTPIGSSLIVHDEPFLWLEATDDGTYRTDSYLTSDASYSVSVVTKLGHPQLATVTGGSPFGTVDGRFSGGSYHDNYVESGTPGDGDWAILTYQVDLANSQLHWEHRISSGVGTTSSSESWENSTGAWSLSTDYNDGYGNSSWSESEGTGGLDGGTTTRTRSGGSSTEQNPSGTVTVFGREFPKTGSESSWETESGLAGTTRNYSHTSDSYADGDSSLTVITANETVAGTASTTVTGWTPEIGHFSATMPTNGISNWSTVAWAPRDDPTFAPATLRVNGWLVTRQSGTLASSGVVTDVYDGASGQLQMSISGDVREVALGNATAEVRIQGTLVGSVDSSGTFSLNGWIVSTAQEGASSGTPFFLPNAAVLWVDGAEYGFAAGYSDGNGGHVDTYSASSGEGQLCLAGTAQGVANLAGNRFTTFFHGSLSSGSFTISGAVVSVTSQPPPAALPQALWVRGRFYSQLAATPGTYRWQPPGDSAPFTLTAVSESGGFQLTGTDDVGSFSGTLPAGGGLHFLHAGEGTSAPQTVPVHEASSAGVPMAGGGNLSPYPGTPLAVEVAGSVFVFSCVLPTPLRAIYVPDNLSTSGRWLALRLDTQVVQLTDHAAAPAILTNGSYDPATFLFSTSPGSGSLPEYVHAADSQGNCDHLCLPRPVGMDLPPSFIVRGQPWWFAGWGEEINIATYRGFYTGQVMTVGNAMLTEGGPTERLVTLVDPVYNAALPNPLQQTQGTLSDVRRSVRLRDGTIVLSGNELGGEETIGYEDDHSLHTIRSDLDILGNNLSFGILNDDASLAGMAWRFEDLNGISRLHSMLSRPQAEWIWWKAGIQQAHELQPVMQLGTSNRLHLYPPGSTHLTPPGIILDPAEDGVSSIRGVLRVRPGGDIDMGDFTAGGQP